MDTVTLITFTPKELQKKVYSKLVGGRLQELKKEFTKYFDGFFHLKGRVPLEDPTIILDPFDLRIRPVAQKIFYKCFNLIADVDASQQRWLASQ